MSFLTFKQDGYELYYILWHVSCCGTAKNICVSIVFAKDVLSFRINADMWHIFMKSKIGYLWLYLLVHNRNFTNVESRLKIGNDLIIKGHFQ